MEFSLDYVFMPLDCNYYCMELKTVDWYILLAVDDSVAGPRSIWYRMREEYGGEYSYPYVVMRIGELAKQGLVNKPHGNLYGLTDDGEFVVSVARDCDTEQEAGERVREELGK